MVRKALFASLALAPITIVLHYVAQPSDTVQFVLAAVSLVPLAWLIGEATEHAARLREVQGVRTYIPEPHRRGHRVWVDKAAGQQEAVYTNRRRCAGTRVFRKPCARC